MTWPNDVITRTVTGTYVSGSGTPAKGRVTFTPTSTVYDQNDAIIVDDTLTATLDVDGFFEIDLPTTDNGVLTPQNWAYEVNVRLYGVKPKRFYITLPYGDGSVVSLVNQSTAAQPLPLTINEIPVQPSPANAVAAPGGFNDVITRVVTGTYLTSLGEPAKGRVTFTPSARVVDESDAVIVEDTISVPLDVNGYFEIELPTTDNKLLSPKNWAYEVNVRLYGVKPHRFYATLPYGDGSAVDIENQISTSPTTSIGAAYPSGSPSQGSIGPRGPGVLSGEGVPSSTIGYDGDIYIDGVDGAFYGPKADGAWPNSPFFTPSQLGAQRFIHTQNSPSNTWNITHSLGGRPSVMVVDTGGTVVIGEIRYNSNTSITILFTAPFSGYAYLT